MRIREFLTRSRLPHEWMDPDADPHVDNIVRAFSLEPSDLPVVIATGEVLRKPTPGELASYLGLTLDSLPDRFFDLVIVGGGPAGLAAAVYGASEGLHTLGVDMIAPGGQAGTSSRIENYFGFTTGISGAELTHRGLIQAEKFGARLSAPCTATALREELGHLTLELSDGTVVGARAVIAATGARYRRLPVERLQEFEATGVYYAATELEARQCAGSPVMVVGGGNSAGQAAVFLAESCRSVTLVIRSADINAHMSRYLVDRLLCHVRGQSDDRHERGRARGRPRVASRSRRRTGWGDSRPGQGAVLVHRRRPRVRRGSADAQRWTTAVSCSLTVRSRMSSWGSTGAPSAAGRSRSRPVARACSQQATFDQAR